MTFETLSNMARIMNLGIHVADASKPTLCIPGVTYHYADNDKEKCQILSQIPIIGNMNHNHFEYVLNR